MAGICGIVSERGNCINDLFLETFYLQHRAQDYCGLFWYSNGNIMGSTHKGLLEANFSLEVLRDCQGSHGIGSVSVSREPISGLSRHQSGTITFDGNLYNNQKLKDYLLRERAVFSGYHFPEQISDCDLISNLVLNEFSFEKGIESLLNLIEGDFAVVNLTSQGIYAARGFGRKPLVLGIKETDEFGKSYAVASESTSFVNTGFEILRDVNPGEIVFIDKTGIHTIFQKDLEGRIKYGTFEWIYTSYPDSVIDGRSVSEVRKRIGALLARKYAVEADIVSPIPNSGRWHAIGYSQESKIPYEEVFIRFDYSGRSFTPGDSKKQQLIADTKLIPVRSSISGKRIVSVDDSIVRGTQTKKQVQRLHENGAREVHGRIACPPLMCACPYGKSTSKDEDCIASRMSIEDIRTSRRYDTLEYATIEMLEEAIGFPRDKLCLTCWGG